MFLLKKSDWDRVARPTVKLAQEAIKEGYTLVGECDDDYNIIKPLDKLPEAKAEKAEAEKPKAKGKAKAEGAE